MNFIEKEKLIKADIVSIENRVRHAFNQGYDLGFKDGKEKAKPQDIDYKAQYERLSQKAEIVISQLRADRDRLMSLSSVTPQEPKTEWQKDHEILKAYSDGANDVLDKIRTEIGNINLNEVAAKYEDRFYGFQREVIKIIDKYKGESER